MDLMEEIRVDKPLASAELVTNTYVQPIRR